MADLQEQNLACIFAASAPARTQYLHPYRQCTPRPWGATANKNCCGLAHRQVFFAFPVRCILLTVAVTFL
ncbi:MAG: hypothetical protein ACJATV_001655 [Granulosicoccus sp.]|jgi:hypothetical protein